MKYGWIAVDLDGTLAYLEQPYNVYKVGDPIPEMLARVKQWIQEGQEVRIFTARVAYDEKHGATFVQAQRVLIQEWCERYIGEVIPITAEKNFDMIQMWDDRAVQVITNTGQHKE